MIGEGPSKEGRKRWKTANILYMINFTLPSDFEYNCDLITYAHSIIFLFSDVYSSCATGLLVGSIWISTVQDCTQAKPDASNVAIAAQRTGRSTRKGQLSLWRTGLPQFSNLLFKCNGTTRAVFEMSLSRGVVAVEPTTKEPKSAHRTDMTAVTTASHDT